MKQNSLYRNLLVGLSFIYIPAATMANGDRYTHAKWQADLIKPMISDTIPDGKKNQDEVIKEVPKSRKQLKPVAVPIIVKAVLVKPKAIIKPVIKIH